MTASATPENYTTLTDVTREKQPDLQAKIPMPSAEDYDRRLLLLAYEVLETRENAPGRYDGRGNALLLSRALL